VLQCSFFCDSELAIKAFDNTYSNSLAHYSRKLLSLRQHLSHTSVTVKLVKIPVHSGIAVNVMADKLAKDTAYKLFKGEVSLSTNVTVSSAFKMSVEISRKPWQRLWENEHSGRYTYNLIPHVTTKVLFLHNVTLVYHIADYYYTILC